MICSQGETFLINFTAAFWSHWKFKESSLAQTLSYKRILSLVICQFLDDLLAKRWPDCWTNAGRLSDAHEARFDARFDAWSSIEFIVSFSVALISCSLIDNSKIKRFKYKVWVSKVSTVLLAGRLTRISFDRWWLDGQFMSLLAWHEKHFTEGNMNK